MYLVIVGQLSLDSKISTTFLVLSVRMLRDLTASRWG